MEGLEVTVLLGAAVLVGAVLAPRLRSAVPPVLLLIGVALGFVPALRSIELPPEAVLLLFLPALLFWESLTTSLRAVRRDLRGIVLLSTLLPVATAFAVAGIAHLFGMPFAAALILGAAVAPPDATAVAALGRSLPHRNFMLLKAESLTNDGTALVVSSIAVGVATGGHYTALQVTGLVLLSYLGGIAAGAATAAVSYAVLRRLRDPLLINVALLVTPFAAYLLAESVGASGVLAVVVTGLIAALLSARISTAASRRQTESAWPLGTYLLNGALFVLIGLQVQAIAHTVDAAAIGRLLLIVIAVWITLLVVRFIFQMTTVTLIRLLDRRPSQRGRRMSHRARVVSAVAGFRGAVSLAIALSVPNELAAPGLGGRDAIVFVTAGVIVLTLLVQGPLLPAVVRWARFPTDTSTPIEVQHAEQAMADAALHGLEQTAEAERIPAAVRDHVIKEVRGTTLQHLDGPDRGAAPSAAATTHEQARRLRMTAITHKRDVLNRLRRDGSIDDAVALRLQTRLDVEELRLTGIDHFD
jgi:CPA1 family monovalent cation:H+ antiporter